MDPTPAGGCTDMKVLGDAGSMIRDLKTNGGFHLSGLFKNNIFNFNFNLMIFSNACTHTASNGSTSETLLQNSGRTNERGTDCDPVDENFNEALRLARSGNFKDAEQSIQKALDLDLEGRREKMICSIPDQEALAMDRKTFAMMDQMALILAFGGYDDKDYDRAKKFNDSAYKACLERFGEEDPGTLCTIYHKALILGYYKKYKEAEKSIQKACNGQKSRLGEDHPDTLHSMYYRALVLEQNGKITEAQEVYKKALGGCKEDCEKKHPQPGSGVRVHQLMETIEKKITS